ncbi:MAG TPA: glycosyltransferase [Longimicrobiales bacterium]|nr:glycosyltransferase [Longimicrobiales bacterium]
MSSRAAPDVSVLLPVRNGERTLERALASLDRQLFRRFEVVAVDDGSSDATAAILARWARTDPRVRPVGQPPLGIVAALETARRHARGRWLARMDADDEAHPMRLFRQYELAVSDGEVGLVGCHVRYAPRAGLSDGARRYEAWLNALVTPQEIARDVWVECPVAHPTFFLRADVLEDVGGYRDMGWPEDYDLLLRLHLAGVRCRNVPARLLRWWDDPGRLSRNAPAYSPAAFRRCKVHHLRRSLLAGRAGAVIWGAGPTGKAFSRALLDAGIAVLAFVEVDPRKIGQDIHGAPVVPVEEAITFAEALHLGAVGRAGGRASVRATAARVGLLEGGNFVAIA